MGGTVTWTGADGSNPTHHDVAANWSAGAGGTAPPAADDHVIIPNVTNDPVLQDHDAWGSLIINSGGDLDGNGKTLTLASTADANTFRWDGTISGNLDVTITGGDDIVVANGTSAYKAIATTPIFNIGLSAVAATGGTKINAYLMAD